MPFKAPYELTTRIRGVCYSAFSSPNLGITWAMFSLVSGLIYLIYAERKVRIFDETTAGSHDENDHAVGIDCIEREL
jgi:hypothetical protein